MVGPVADVTTALSGPTTLGAGLSSGTFTATFTNNGPQAATQLTQTVRLPTGASMTAAQQAALPASACTKLASVTHSKTVSFRARNFSRFAGLAS